MIFKETQKFKQPWIWAVLIITGTFTIGEFGFGLYKQILHGQKFGNNPMSDNGLIFTFILVLILFFSLFFLFFTARLTTVIDKMGIKYKFSPFHAKSRMIYWNMIQKHEVKTYDPLAEYGGWGIKSNKSGKAYNVSGNKGLIIYLKTGKTVLIGTQKEKELTDFLSNI
jgi:hypothetical protein